MLHVKRMMSENGSRACVVATPPRLLMLSVSPRHSHSHSTDNFSWQLILTAVSVAALGAASLPAQCTNEGDAPGVTAQMPVYTRAQVALHTDVADGVWTTFGNGVYDITGFIENHPGGSDKVVLAAGGKLENYWNLYRQHYSSPTPRQYLAKMCIGRVHPDDLMTDRKNIQNLEDPFSMDPDVSPVLRCFVKKPVNAEPPGPLLTHSFLTPNDIFFVRNHHPVPRKLAEADYKIDDDQYVVIVEIEGSRDGRRPVRQVRLSLAELKSRFPCREVVASLQCGGNRREELSSIEQTAGAKATSTFYYLLLTSVAWDTPCRDTVAHRRHLDCSLGGRVPVRCAALCRPQGSLREVG